MYCSRTQPRQSYVNLASLNELQTDPSSSPRGMFRQAFAAAPLELLRRLSRQLLTTPNPRHLNSRSLTR